ncbi:MAG: hypothetical protein ACKOW9_02500, partial [Candidatus Paceibacterota bacterium]
STNSHLNHALSYFNKLRDFQQLGIVITPAQKQIWNGIFINAAADDFAARTLDSNNSGESQQDRFKYLQTTLHGLGISLSFEQISTRKLFLDAIAKRLEPVLTYGDIEPSDVTQFTSRLITLRTVLSDNYQRGRSISKHNPQSSTDYRIEKTSVTLARRLLSQICEPMDPVHYLERRNDLVESLRELISEIDEFSWDGTIETLRKSRDFIGQLAGLELYLRRLGDPGRKALGDVMVIRNKLGANDQREQKLGLIDRLRRFFRKHHDAILPV